jgi:poly(A) polymerase
MSDTGVECAHPFNKGFERIHSCKTEDEVDLIFQGDIQFEISEEKAAELEAIAEAEDSANGEVKPILIYTTTYYIGLELGETDGMFLL